MNILYKGLLLSGTRRRVDWQKNLDVSKVHTATIFRVQEKVHFGQTERRHKPEHSIYSHGYSSSVFPTKHCAYYQLSFPCGIPPFSVPSVLFVTKIIGIWHGEL